jgi:hypothetical protein
MFGRRVDRVPTRARRGHVATAGVAVLLLTACAASGPPRLDRSSGVSPARFVEIAVFADVSCDPASPYWNGGAGDATHCRMKSVSHQIGRLDPDLLLLAGDAQYEYGTPAAYTKSYDRFFGKFRSITYPVSGNHDWGTPGARGFFGYFAGRGPTPKRPWYSVDVPLGASTVHIVGLDSNCPEVGGCGNGSRQHRWLRHDLATHPATCTVAFWHHPFQNSGAYAGDPTVKAYARPLWRTAARHGVDVILNGHDHMYERFAPRNHMRQFTVGTGGKSHYLVTHVASGSRFRDDRHFGVLDLRFTVGGGYAWHFVTARGQVRDRGSGVCGNH